jgi:hypothetical protein
MGEILTMNKKLQAMAVLDRISAAIQAEVQKDNAKKYRDQIIKSYSR